MFITYKFNYNLKNMRIYRIIKICKNEKLRVFLSTLVSSQKNVVAFNKKIDSVITERNNYLLEHTLTGRLLLYLHNENEKNFKKNRIVNQKQHPITTSMLNEVLNFNTKLTIADIASAILKLKPNHKKMLNTLDLICSSYLEDLNTEEVFYILHTFVNVISSQVTELKFYKVATHHMQKNIEFTKKSDLLQLMLYLSLDKTNNKPAMKKCLKQLYKLEMVNELNLNELCIVCNATFKTSTKIKNKELLEKVKGTINDNLAILQDSRLFITFVKTLRHNKYQDDDILSTIMCTILFNKTMNNYSFIGICHILALYSDCMYYEEPILRLCIETGIKQLREYDRNVFKGSYHTKIIRMKDIKRFLWAISRIGYKNFDVNWCKDVIVPRILEKIKNKEYKCDTESIAECILYLWMLDYRAVELFPNVLTPASVQLIREQKSRCKYRLNLLLSAMQFEDREMFKKLNIKPQGKDYDLDYQIQSRPMLLRVHENLKILSKMSSVNIFEISFQVPYLNIAGITGFKNNVYKAVNIEVLDDYTSVKKKFCYPSGLMQLKLRILRKLPEPVITICQEEIQGMTNLELQDYLKEELEFV